MSTVAKRKEWTAARREELRDRDARRIELLDELAARTGLSVPEDDGYLVTLVTDMNEDRSECLVFAATDLAAGPIALLALPERISSGTHSCRAPAALIAT